MNKNILAFVNKYYFTYTTPYLILRVLALFLISYGAIAYVEVYSPYGYDSITFFSEKALPYTITLTITAMLISVISILLFLHKIQWRLVLMRGLTNIYISILFLVASCMDFNGYELSFADIHIIIFEILVYLFVIPIQLFVLIKFIIPKSRNRNENKSNSSLIILGVSAFRLMLNTSNGIDIQKLLAATAYFLSLTLLVNAIYFFTQSYYAKKYSINTKNDSSYIPARTLHDLNNI